MISREMLEAAWEELPGPSKPDEWADLLDLDVIALLEIAARSCAGTVTNHMPRWIREELLEGKSPEVARQETFLLALQVEFLTAFRLGLMIGLGQAQERDGGST